MKVYDKIGTNDFDGSNTIYLKDTFFPFDTVTFGIF